MKKIIALVVWLCLSISLVACGPSTATSASITEGNQEEFLKDMAAGINDRLANDRDTSNMTDEQIIKLYTKLVNYELNKIEQYDGLVFPDSRFNDLAHLYIDGCKMQLKACELYKDMSLYNALWPSGYNVRCAVITSLYRNYDLPISSETAINYDLNRQTVPPDNNTIVEVDEENAIKETFDYSNAKDNAEFGFLDYTQFETFLYNGVFRCGTDFEPGKYYIMSLYDGEANYSATTSPNDFSWSHYTLMRCLNIKKGEYIKLTNGQIMVPEELIDSKNWNKYSVMRVGEDLYPGDYQIESITDLYRTDLYAIQGISGAIQISERSPVDQNILFESYRKNEQGYITLKEGQYVVGLNVRIKKVS